MQSNVLIRAQQQDYHDNLDAARANVSDVVTENSLQNASQATTLCSCQDVRLDWT